MLILLMAVLSSVAVSEVEVDITVYPQSVKVTYKSASIASIFFRKEPRLGKTILETPLAQDLYSTLHRYVYSQEEESDFQRNSLLQHFLEPSSEVGITNDIIGLSTVENNELTCKYRDGFVFGTLSASQRGISENFITLPNRRRLCHRLHKLRLFVLQELDILATSIDWDDWYMKAHPQTDTAYFSNDYRQGRVYGSGFRLLPEINVVIDSCNPQRFEVEDNTWLSLLEIAKALAQDVVNHSCKDNFEPLVFKIAKRRTPMDEKIGQALEDTIRKPFGIISDALNGLFTG